MSDTDQHDRVSDSDPPEFGDEPTGVILRRVSREIREHVKEDREHRREVSAHMKASDRREAFQLGAWAAVSALGALGVALLLWVLSTVNDTARTVPRMQDAIERNTADVRAHDDRLRAVERMRGGT